MKVSEEVRDAYQLVKTGKKSPYVIYKIENSEIIVPEAVGNESKLS